VRDGGSRIRLTLGRVPFGVNLEFCTYIFSVVHPLALYQPSDVEDLVAGVNMKDAVSHNAPKIMQVSCDTNVTRVI
jgi:hypothetical protein